MRVLFCTTLVCFSFLLGGCAIHPAPEDFSRKSLADIVFHVQCEARREILASLEDEALLLAIGSTEEAKRKPNYSPMTAFQNAKYFHKHLLSTVLLLEFAFTLTENDDFTSKGGVTIPISLGSFKIGWDAGAEKQRQSLRTVRFSDTFKEVIKLPCGSKYGRKNYIYPVTGNVGLTATFDNFVRIAARQLGSELQTYSDAVEFKTIVRGAITPEINLVPNAGRLIKANFNASLKRTDFHRVTLTFTQAKTADQLATLSTAAANAVDKALALIARERKIPQRIQWVDATNENAIVPTKGFSQVPISNYRKGEPAGGGLETTPLPSDDFSSAPRQRRPSTSEIDRETKRAAERDFLIERRNRIDQEILDRIDR